MPLPMARGGAVKKPKPFQRPGIVLSEGGVGKRWVKADPRNVGPGDIIRGEGLIVEWEGFTLSGPEAGPIGAEAWMVYTMKNGKRLTVSVYPLEYVIAFTSGPGEPVG